ncbi:hypothetical protein KA005_67110, partial [bacterium]|nr:hypothetical protein [bacterium]
FILANRLTAYPETDSKILSWSGCNEVSADLTECICSLSSDHLVSVNFGYVETLLKENVTLVDLSETLTTINDDQTVVIVEASHGDTEMVEKLAAVVIGDVIVGSAGEGFLLRVIGTKKTSDYKYTYNTSAISLEEVIAQGTGELFKQLTHEDLMGGAETAELNTQKLMSSSLSSSTFETPATPEATLDTAIRFEGIEGVKLLPPEKPNDNLFKIKIGNDQNDKLLSMKALESSVEGSVEWELDDGTKVTAKGDVTFSVEFETGVSYGLFSGLEYFKFIPKMTAEESLEVSFGGEIKTKKDFAKQKIGTIYFAPVSFMIGPVPVWIKPEIPIYIGANGKVSAEIETGVTFSQTIQAGIVYNKNAGKIKGIANFSHSFNFDKPTAEVSVEAKGYIQPNVTMKVYSVMGPSIPIDGYLKLKGEVEPIKLLDEAAT